MTMDKIRIIGSDYSPISEAVIHINGEKAEALPQLNIYDLLKDCKTPDNKPLIQFYGRNIYFGGFVGVVRIFRENEYDITLQLKSRFDEGNKAHFVAAMLLSDDNKLKIRKERVEISYDDIFEILLMYLFQEQLQTAASKGIYRRYVRFENNDSRPHGVIDISRHIKLNGNMNNGKIAYNYRELTANNSLNRLILAAYYKLKSKFPGIMESGTDSKLASTIKNLEAEIGYTELNARKLVSQNLNPITHPYYHEYEALRKTCLKILRDEGLSIFDAKCCDDIESLLVYVPKLWEKYLERCLEKQLKKEQFIPQDTKAYCTSILENTAKPDFVFYKDGKTTAILDAKFKKIWGDVFGDVFKDLSKYKDNENNWKKDAPDVQENKKARIDNDINKCIRDMTVFNANRTGVIVPYHIRSDQDIKTEDFVQCDVITDEKLFDMVAIPVPGLGELGFPEWHEKFRNSTSVVLTKYLEAISLITENKS